MATALKKILLVVGTRPNFVKAAPLYKAFLDRGVTPTLVHTNQHSSQELQGIFYKDFDVPPAETWLRFSEVDGFLEPEEQLQRMYQTFEKLFTETPFDLVVVFGDVRSTLAAARAAAAKKITLAHVEAGLRSRNNAMPEEHIRKEVDHLSDFLFITEKSGEIHLREEGVAKEKMHFVGNVMIDALLQIEPSITPSLLEKFQVAQGTYALVTLHRTENVDSAEKFLPLWKAVCRTSKKIPVLFPIHPRTRAKLADFERSGLKKCPNTFRLIDPVGYRDMLTLEKYAKFVMTDSGGVQEETTALGVPCLTLRTETERPSTIEVGTNEVIGIDENIILTAVDRVLTSEWKKGSLPEKWDGHAAERIVDILLQG